MVCLRAAVQTGQRQTLLQTAGGEDVVQVRELGLCDVLGGLYNSLQKLLVRSLPRTGQSRWCSGHSLLKSDWHESGSESITRASIQTLMESSAWSSPEQSLTVTHLMAFTLLIKASQACLVDRC